MTFEEAYQRLPMDGVDDLRISWDLSQGAGADEVLAARRGLAYDYWLNASVDWTPLIPVGRFLSTEQYYQNVLAPFAMASAVGASFTGPIWVKFMGVERTGQDQARVTFCTDIGWWHRSTENKRQVRKNRANLESYVLKNVQTDDGEPRWLVDQRFNPDGDREAKYGAQCTKWAQHNKP